MPACAQNAEKKSTVEKAESTPAVINLTQAEFLKKVADYKKNPNEWIYLGSVPAIVDFYADWCGPCKQIAPVLEQLAKDYKGKIVIYKVNTDKEQELARTFGIRSIPSLLFVPKDGKPQMAMHLDLSSMGSTTHHDLNYSGLPVRCETYGLEVENSVAFFLKRMGYSLKRHRSHVLK